MQNTQKMCSRYVLNKLLIAPKSRLLLLTMMTPFVIKLVSEVYGLFGKLRAVITSLDSTYNHCHQLCFSSKY